MLEIRNLTASLEGKNILKNISFSFEDGKTYALIGPNGSGKSTLASAVMGRPDITLDETSEIFLDGENITSLTPEKRAKKGLFLSFQSPPALAGVSAFRLLRAALPDEKATDIDAKIKKFARELDIADDLLKRGLHDGFSGGERKKFEALLFTVLSPRIAFFDEIDTGVDVDARKTIGRFLLTEKRPDQTFILITHSTDLLEILAPDETIILKDGRISEIGDGTLAQRIIAEEGFANK